MLTYKHFIANSEEEGDALFLALQLLTGKEFRDVKINYRPDGVLVYHIAVDEKEDITRLIELLNKKAANK